MRASVEKAQVIKNDWLFRNMKAKFTIEEQAELARSVVLLQRLVEL